MMKALMPVIMASILGIYGLVIGVLINGSISSDGTYEFYSASLHFAAGLCVGIGSLSAGYVIGDIGNIGAYAFVNNPKLFIMFVFLLIFAEILGLYGLIMAIVLFTYSNSK
ncbi:putative V-type proton ATPase proteolipid subunit 2 [Mitosporidium daphniae]|uniref:V-type proton ATPase proteolipid subunit n=1 Tax=Mitosporidium daphniae TaxID=1485682 RepID=A0A098VR83_9MICR|nr:putative V-type proton ATPase proteolipid subunit 2 [Mitosporidium daphniae]KGG51440.1 putative V-type proton ATPase proteolipid subunit 2 [Mitosporidium daphniae]|eukprot:XP_013237867.1 putative V-type proton ATPase proteolipid subunit 2 [Mitosporidium daphniae]